MNERVIVPYVGVDNYRFGASIEEVNAREGEPFKVEVDDVLKLITEHRRTCEYVYRNKKLVTINLSKYINPVIDGIEIYADGGVDALKLKYPRYVEGKKYVVFLDIGICVGGFSQKKIPEDKTVIVFDRPELPLFELFARTS